MRHWTLASRLTDVPDLNTALATSVDVASRVADSHGTHNLPMTECVNLTSMAWDPWTNESVWREGHRLHLSVSADVERVGSERDRQTRRERPR